MDAFCTECIYDPEAIGAGTKNQQIEDCTAPECPLYEWRPVTKATREKRKAEAYAAMSPEEKAKYDAKVEDAKERFAKQNS